jgi:DNA polymerase-3 subunit epsilon
MSWKDEPWAVIDTETTGVKAGEDRVVELGVVIRHPKVVTSSSWLVNPGREIPAEVTAVHGIKTADVVGRPTIREVADEFFAKIADARVIVVYNWPFDSRFLTCELGDRWEAYAADRLVVDPLVVVRLDQVGRYWKGPGRHKLGSVASRLGVQGDDGAHRTEADCMMCLRVLEKLVGYLPDDPKQVSLMLDTSRRRQDRDYEAYLARTSR